MYETAQSVSRLPPLDNWVVSGVARAGPEKPIPQSIRLTSPLLPERHNAPRFPASLLQRSTGPSTSGSPYSSSLSPPGGPHRPLLTSALSRSRVLHLLSMYAFVQSRRTPKRWEVLRTWASHRLLQPLLQLAISTAIIPPSRVFVNPKSNKINILKSSDHPTSYCYMGRTRRSILLSFAHCTKRLILLGYKVCVSPEKIFT